MSVQFLYLLISVLFIAGKGEPVLAQTPDSSQISSLHDLRNTFNNILAIPFSPSTNGDSQPADTRGAGSRNDRQCHQDRPTPPPNEAVDSDPGLTALVPLSNYGLTQSDRPIFWVHIPPTSAQAMILSIKEETAQQPTSQVRISLPDGPGVVGIRLAEELPPLEVNKTYQWAVVLLCGNRPSPNDPAITAWVRRVSPSPISWDSSQPSYLEQAWWYGQQGLWYDVLTSLAQAQGAQPGNPELTHLWTEFLARPFIGLEPIAQAPLHPLILPQSQLPTNTNAAQ